CSRRWRAKFLKPSRTAGAPCLMVRSPERLGRGARRDRGLSDISPSSPTKIAVRTDRVRGLAEQVCEKWTLTILRLNSLLAPKNSLLGLQKFPVPLRRGFRWKSLNSLVNWTPNCCREPESAKFPANFPVNREFGVGRLVRSGLQPPPSRFSAVVFARIFAFF